MNVDSPVDRAGDGLRWLRPFAHDMSPEGRVTAADCGWTPVAVTRSEDEYTGPDTNGLHQDKPLGVRLFKTGWVRFPWHGLDIWQPKLVNSRFPELAENRGGVGVFVENEAVIAHEDPALVEIVRDADPVSVRP